MQTLYIRYSLWPYFIPTTIWNLGIINSVLSFTEQRSWEFRYVFKAHNLQELRAMTWTQMEMISEPMLFSPINNSKAAFQLLIPTVVGRQWLSQNCLWKIQRSCEKYPGEKSAQIVSIAWEMGGKQVCHSCCVLDVKPFGLQVPGLLSDLKLENSLLYFSCCHWELKWHYGGPATVLASKTQICSNEIDIFEHDENYAFAYAEFHQWEMLHDGRKLYSAAERHIGIYKMHTCTHSRYLRVTSVRGYVCDEPLLPTASITTSLLSDNPPFTTSQELRMQPFRCPLPRKLQVPVKVKNPMELFINSWFF